MKIDEKAEIHAFNEWFVGHYRKTGFIWSKQEALDVWLARARQPVRVKRELLRDYCLDIRLGFMDHDELAKALGLELVE